MLSRLARAAKSAAVVMILAAMLYAAGCAGGYSTTLTEPQGDNMLLMGSVIVENVGYRNKQESYTKDIEVSFMGDVEEEGETVRKSITIFADENGYFAVENVPQGQWALKGIRAYTPGGDWTIWNELRMPNERWAVAPATFYYPFTGTHFPTSPVGNVYNYHHNVFSVLPGQEVRHYRIAYMEGDQFHLTDTYDRPLVVEYFLEKYPNSGWVPILEQQLPEEPPRN